MWASKRAESEENGLGEYVHRVNPGLKMVLIWVALVATFVALKAYSGIRPEHDADSAPVAKAKVAATVASN